MFDGWIGAPITVKQSLHFFFFKNVPGLRNFTSVDCYPSKILASALIEKYNHTENKKCIPNCRSYEIPCIGRGISNFYLNIECLMKQTVLPATIIIVCNIQHYKRGL